MTRTQFAELVGLTGKTEIERARFLAFYELERNNITEFTASDISAWFGLLSFAAPNRSRLDAALRASRLFIKGTSPGTYRLHASTLATLRAAYPKLKDPSEEVVSLDTILPAPLYAGTRGYIEALSKQINAAYEHNLFDAAAVLMRRLLEILLIHSYQNLKIEAAIQSPSGDFLMLEAIVTDAKVNRTLALSRNSRGCIDTFRVLGNFSAHKLFYVAKRSDIANATLEYRALIEELLYKAGIRS